MKSTLRWHAVVGAFVMAVALGACSPTSYTMRDFESFKRPGLDVSKYRRVGVLYMGSSYGSQQVQADMGSAKPGAQKASGTTSSQTEASSFDYMLFSNALLSSFARRGVELVERNRVNDLVREQGITNSGMLDISDLEQIQKLGQMLKVDLLIKGSVFTSLGGFVYANPIADGQSRSSYSKEYFCALYGLSVTAVDTRTGELVWVETLMFTKRVVPDELEDNSLVGLDAAIREMVEEMVARFYSDKAHSPVRHSIVDGAEDDYDEEDFDGDDGDDGETPAPRREAQPVEDDEDNDDDEDEFGE